MAYRRLTLKNFRCFAATSIPLHPQVTVLIGENGTGKTTIAEALASLCYGDDEGLEDFPLRYQTRTGRVALYRSRRPDAVWQIGRESSRQRLADDDLLFAYGRYRRVVYPEPKPTGLEAQILSEEWRGAYSRPSIEIQEQEAAFGPRTDTLSQPDTHMLRDVGAFVVSLHRRRGFDRRSREAWRRLEDSVAALGQGLEGVEVVEENGREIPKVRRRGVSVPLEALSDGYQSVLVIVLNLLLRFRHLLPSLEDPTVAEALVVIDEIDLHLHPRWQRGVLRQLVTLFPKVQFVVSTHSAAVVQGAIDDGFGVVRLEEEHVGKVARVQARAFCDKELLDLRGAEIGSVMMASDLFDVESRYSLAGQALERSVSELRQRVESGEGDDGDRLRLIEELEKLEMLLVRDEARRQDGHLISELAKSQIAFLKKLEERIQKAGDQ